jgi:hypothetical protein
LYLWQWFNATEMVLFPIIFVLASLLIAFLNSLWDALASSHHLLSYKHEQKFMISTGLIILWMDDIVQEKHGWINWHFCFWNRHACHAQTFHRNLFAFLPHQWQVHCSHPHISQATPAPITCLLQNLIVHLPREVSMSANHVCLELCLGCNMSFCIISPHWSHKPICLSIHEKVAACHEQQQAANTSQQAARWWQVFL